jgi:hypothetical protein
MALNGTGWHFDNKWHLAASDVTKWHLAASDVTKWHLAASDVTKWHWTVLESSMISNGPEWH